MVPIRIKHENQKHFKSDRLQNKAVFLGIHVNPKTVHQFFLLLKFIHEIRALHGQGLVLLERPD